jgi:hypothetical protein
VGLDIAPEALQLVVQAGLALLRIGGRDERAGIELPVVAVAALEPDGELARHAQLVQRLAVVALALVDGCVTDAAQVVEDRSLRRADDALLEEAVDELVLALLGIREEADLGRGPLREDLRELPELEEGDRGIAGEVLLGLRRERHQARVVVGEVCEVRGRSRGQGERPGIPRVHAIGNADRPPPRDHPDPRRGRAP